MNSDLQDVLNSFKQDLEKAISYLKSEYSSLKAGRANPHILDKISVDYYGTMTPINQMANISIPEARLLVISLWDTSMIKEVNKAIINSDIGLTPNDDGKVIRLNFPMLTEERRKELVKTVKKLCEDCKISMRNYRRDSLDMLKSIKDGISEDEISSCEKEIQKIMDNYNQIADKTCQDKEKEVMEV